MIPELRGDALDAPHHQPALADLPGFLQQRGRAADGTTESGLDASTCRSQRDAGAIEAWTPKRTIVTQPLSSGEPQVLRCQDLQGVTAL